jgi:hypothetical protein
MDVVILGMLVSVTAITLDEIFYTLGFWTYPYDAIPLLPRLTSVDYTLVPLIFKGIPNLL